MSLIKTKSIQLGWDNTPTNNFTIYQPATPDGTFRIANGNAGSTTDIMTVSSNGSVVFGGTTSYAGLGFGTGSATTPALFPVGDTNTGIYFPTAETIGFSTNGLERVRIDSAGNIGVGTDTPAHKLQVQSSNDTAISVVKTGVVAGTVKAVSTAMIFGVDQNVGNTERMRINSSGYVGIGTDSPSGKLNVLGAGNAPGGTVLLSGSKLNNTGKWGTICAEQYANTAEPEGYTVINANSYAGTNAVIIGGGLDEQNAATVIAFRTAGNETTRAGTTRMVINNGGRVGINTEAPTATLDVAGGLSLSGWSNNNSGSAGGAELGWDGAQSIFQSYNRVGGAYTPIALNASYHRFLISGTEKARITSYGLAIGGTDQFQQLSLTGGIGFMNWNSADKKLYSPADGCLEWMTHTGAGAHNFAVSHQGTQRVILDASGQIYAVYTSISGISDISQKENIREIPYGLATVNELTPVMFDFTEHGIGDGAKDILGFIAQDVEPAIPELVTESSTGLKTLKMGDMIPVLVKAIQELNAKIDAQAAEIAALKAQK